jgi:GNAT superfamily N-acetyltransferase
MYNRVNSFPVIEVLPDQVTPALISLFDPSAPTAIRCYAVLGGGNAGRIFTDNLEHPRSGYVWERDDGTLYQGGDKDWRVMHQLVMMLRQEGTVALDFRDGNSDVELFPPDPEAGAECIELDRPAGSSDLSKYMKLPPGFEVHRMGRELIEKSPRLDESLFRYGSLEIYLEKGMDVCILHGEEFVCEAGADMDVGGVREVGVVTERPYRGRGFGTIVTAHLLQWCDELGCSTYWDCVKLNIGSLKMARKLGFGNERGYKILAWFPPKEEIRII